MEQLDSYIQIIKKIKDIVDSVVLIEQDKTAAAVKNDPHFLDEQIRKEQAALLKLRGMEQNRIRIGDSLGWEGLTFRQILDEAPPETAQLLKPVFEELEKSLRSLVSAKDTSDRMLKVRLHEIRSLKAQAGPGGHSTEWRI